MPVTVRGTVVPATVACVIGLGALAAPAADAAPGAVATPTPAAASGPPVVTAWAPAGRAALHPGVVTETRGGGSCTADFVFTDGNRVLLGQAAHCAAGATDTDTDGCDSDTAPDGTPVTVHGSDGRDRTGTMVYSSWVAMQAAGETDPAVCAYNDFALVELSAADAADVNPSVPFFGGPRRVHAGALAVGTPVLTYGNSTVRTGVEALRPKAGTAAGTVGGGFGHEVVTATPGVPGDSGSGVMNTNGEAVGVLSTLNLSPLPVSNGITDLARAMRYAARHGFAELELEPGTEPFTPSPAALLPSRLRGR